MEPSVARQWVDYHRFFFFFPSQEGGWCFFLWPENLLSEEKASNDVYNTIKSSSLIQTRFIQAGLLICLSLPFGPVKVEEAKGLIANVCG